MHVTPLNFFVPPFSPEFAQRTLHAHAIAGLVDAFAWPEGCKDHVWDFPALLGLVKHVKWWGPERAELLPWEAASVLPDMFAAIKHAGPLRRAQQIETILRAVPFVYTPSVVAKARDHLYFRLNQRDYGEFVMTTSILHPDDAAKIPADVYSRLTTSLAALEQALLSADPQMPMHLRNSHALLVTYPESRHLLTDEAIKNLIAAAQKHMSIEIVSQAAKKTGGTRKTGKVSADDL